MNRHNVPSRPRAGFTLLELLVAMALVGLVVTSLYAALAVAFNARSSARAQTHAVGIGMIVLDVIEQDFRNAVPPTGVLTTPFYGEMQRSGTGGVSIVSFCTAGRDGVAADEAGQVNPFFDSRRWVELTAVSGPDGLTLVRRIQRNLLSQTAFEEEVEPLVSGVAAFEVRYFDGYDWLEQWDSEMLGGVMPQAVEIILELEEPSPDDPDRNYRLRQVIPLPVGREPALDDSTGVLP